MTKQIPGPRFNDFTRIILGYQYVPEKDGISLARAGLLRIAYEQAMARKTVEKKKVNKSICFYWGNYPNFHNFF